MFLQANDGQDEAIPSTPPSPTLSFSFSDASVDDDLDLDLDLELSQNLIEASPYTIANALGVGDAAFPRPAHPANDDMLHHHFRPTKIISTTLDCRGSGCGTVLEPDYDAVDVDALLFSPVPLQIAFFSGRHSLQDKIVDPRSSIAFGADACEQRIIPRDSESIMGSMDDALFESHRHVSQGSPRLLSRFRSNLPESSRQDQRTTSFSNNYPSSWEVKIQAQTSETPSLLEAEAFVDASARAAQMRQQTCLRQSSEPRDVSVDMVGMDSISSILSCTSLDFAEEDPDDNGVAQSQGESNDRFGSLGQGIDLGGQDDMFEQMLDWRLDPGSDGKFCHDSPVDNS
jgi:hypothetical protein